MQHIFKEERDNVANFGRGREPNAADYQGHSTATATRFYVPPKEAGKFALGVKYQKHFGERHRSLRN
mgnify:CR=1 FL=1